MKTVKKIALLILIGTLSSLNLNTFANTFKKITTKNLRKLHDVLPWESKNWNDYIYVSNTIGANVIVSINVSTSSKYGITGVCKGGSFKVGIGGSYTCTSSSDVSWASAGTGTGSSYSASGVYSVIPAY